MVKIAKTWCIGYRSGQVDYSRIRIHWKFYKGMRNHKVGELGHITKNGCGQAKANREEVLCVYALDGHDEVHMDSHTYGECPRRLYGMKAKEEYAREVPRSEG